MKRIRLIRPIEDFNRRCAYDIFIGRTKITELKNGEEKHIDIPKDLDAQYLIAKIQWCKSKPFDIRSLKENETTIIRGNKFLNKRLPFLGALFPILGIVNFNVGNPLLEKISVGLLFLLLFYFVGIITIGRDKWLYIKKE